MHDPPLSPKEIEIIKVLYAANKTLSTSQVSRKTGIMWDTAQKYLVELYYKGITLFGAYEGKDKIRWFLKTDNDEERFRFGLSDEER